MPSGSYSDDTRAPAGRRVLQKGAVHSPSVGLFALVTAGPAAGLPRRRVRVLRTPRRPAVHHLAVARLACGSGGRGCGSALAAGEPVGRSRRGVRVVLGVAVGRLGDAVLRLAARVGAVLGVAVGCPRRNGRVGRPTGLGVAGALAAIGPAVGPADGAGCRTARGGCARAWLALGEGHPGSATGRAAGRSNRRGGGRDRRHRASR